MAKESLVVHVRKLLFKKYMKNHNIYIYIFLSRGEENNIRRAHTSTWLKKKKKSLHGFYSNLEINYQFLNLSLSWTC